MSQEIGTTIDRLTEDDVIPGQKWVCLSFVSPEGIRNTNLRLLKVRGVFEEKKDADAYAKQLQEKDPLFDIFVGEVGKWLQFAPSTSDVPDQQYAEKELQDLMEGYHEQQQKAKKMEAERKHEMLHKKNPDQKNPEQGDPVPVKSTRTGNDIRERLRKKIQARDAVRAAREALEADQEQEEQNQEQDKITSNVNKIKKLQNKLSSS